MNCCIHCLFIFCFNFEIYVVNGLYVVNELSITCAVIMTLCRINCKFRTREDKARQTKYLLVATYRLSKSGC